MLYWVTEPELSPADQNRLGLDLGFEDQLLADDWLSANFQQLLEMGVTAVSLYQDGNVLFGPMDLDE